MGKRVIQYLLCVFILLSCSKDDQPQLTNVDGKPSCVKINDYEETNVFFSYQGNRLSEIKEIGGSIQSFNYENEDLLSISVSPEDKRVADGHGYTKFRKESDYKIVVEATGEPNFDMYRHEVELNKNNIPVRITDLGIFGYTGDNGEISRTREGQYYAVFTYGEATNNLIRIVVYDIISSEEVAVYDYEYDSNIGAISKMDLPLWYYAYRAFMGRDYRYRYGRIFFNYGNNLVKENVFKTDNVTEQNTYNYLYKYNKDNVPISMRSDNGEILITY